MDWNDSPAKSPAIRVSGPAEYFGGGVSPLTRAAELIGQCVRPE